MDPEVRTSTGATLMAMIAAMNRTDSEHAVHADELHPWSATQAGDHPLVAITLYRRLLFARLGERVELHEVTAYVNDLCRSGRSQLSMADARVAEASIRWSLGNSRVVDGISVERIGDVGIQVLFDLAKELEITEIGHLVRLAEQDAFELEDRMS